MTRGRRRTNDTPTREVKVPSTLRGGEDDSARERDADNEPSDVPTLLGTEVADPFAVDIEATVNLVGDPFANAPLRDDLESAPGPETRDPDAIDSTVIDPETIDPTAVDPGTIDPTAVDLESLEPEELVLESLEPEELGPEALGPEALGPEALDPEELEMASEDFAGDDAANDESAGAVSRDHLKGLLEALIFASDKPLKASELAKLASAPLKEVKLLLGVIKEDYGPRGIKLDEVAGGFIFHTDPVYAPFVRDMTKQKPVKLTRAQIETLAILAYRQPITRPEIDEIRGVDCGAVLKLLLDRDLIRILGKKDEPGRPLLYGTTPVFLEFFSLKSLKDLPTLREFTELNEESRRVVERELGEVLPAPAEEAPAPTTLPEERTPTEPDMTPEEPDALEGGDDAAEHDALEHDAPDDDAPEHDAIWDHEITDPAAVLDSNVSPTDVSEPAARGGASEEHEQGAASGDDAPDPDHPSSAGSE